MAPDERFWEERRRFRLRHTCEYCVFFDPGTGSCVHGWPNQEHREDHYRRDETGEVVFCKEFEFAG